MKLTLRRDPAAALAKATEDLAGVEAAIASLQRTRMEKLLDAEPSEIEAIDQRIADQHRAATVFRDRIAGLGERVAQEKVAQREADYTAWTARVEATLPACHAADQQYEAAKVALATAIKKIVLSREAALRVYLEGGLQPQTVFIDYFMSMQPLAADIAETWQIPRGHADRRPPQPSEYLVRGADIGPRGYAAAMRERLDELVRDLRDPAPSKVENEEAA